MLFLLTFRILKHKSNISSCRKISKYTSQTLVYPFQPLKTSRLYGLLHFNLEKHQSLFDSWFSTIQYLIHGLFWVFMDLNTCLVPFVLLYSVHKRWSHLSWSGLASKNNSDTLFHKCLTVNTLFYRFWGLSTSKYINQMSVDALYTLNTPRTLYFFFYEH